MHSFFLLPLALATAVAASPTLRPRSNVAVRQSSGGSSIDFSRWSLQVPTGKPGRPDIISSAKLVDGYENPNFYPADGYQVFMVPGLAEDTGCVTTPNAKHCRTELAEVSEGGWNPKCTRNRLRAVVKVMMMSDDAGAAIGQILPDGDISMRGPVFQIVANNDGRIVAKTMNARQNNRLQSTPLGNVPVGTEFSYEVAYEQGKLAVALNGKWTDLDVSGLDSPASRFKAGNYGGGSERSEVYFKEITISH